MRVSSNKLLQKYAQPTSHNAVTLLSAQNLSDSNFPEAAGNIADIDGIRFLDRKFPVELMRGHRLGLPRGSGGFEPAPRFAVQPRLGPHAPNATAAHLVSLLY